MNKVHVGLVVVFVLLGLAGWASPQVELPPVTFHVQLGEENVLQGYEINHYFPSDLTVNVGDTIVFTQVTHEPHTVTFNPPAAIPDSIVALPDHQVAENPQVVLPSPMPQGPPPAPGTPIHLAVNFDGSGTVNSGFLMAPGDTYTVTFTREGKYPYVCLIHSAKMKGTITVNAAETIRPKTDQQYAAEAARQIAQLEAVAEKDLLAMGDPAPQPNAAGAKTWTVITGASDEAAGIDFPVYFGGQRMTIKVGDSVRWTMSHNMAGMPHTVTFLSGGEEPPLLTPQAEKNGPPVLLVNPKLLAPTPAPPAVYRGSGFFNSGVMVAKGPTPQEWTLKFATPGTYHYICVFHDDEGMTGDIIVQP